MNKIKLLIPLALLASCTTTQMTSAALYEISFETQERMCMEKARKLESLGLKEYTVITDDSTYHVTIPIDSPLTYDTFAKYFNNNKK